ncbi:major facilitator superfamily domain-containing protein [Aspergillus varians]
MFSATLLSGPITDRHGPMVVIWPCSLLLILAMMLTSLYTEFYQFLLCQGILLGACCGLIFAPALSIVAHNFMKKRAMAMSFASTGPPIGGIICPIVLNRLIENPNGAFLLFEAFKNPAYYFQVAGLFFVILGFWTPYFYLAKYGLAHGMSTNLSSYLFALINTAPPSCSTAGFLSAGLVVLSLLFGAMSGIIIAMSTVAHRAPHPSKVGTYVGQSTFVVGVAALAGTPITGALINDRGYSAGIVFSASVLMAGAVIFTFARYYFAKDRLIA